MNRTRTSRRRFQLSPETIRTLSSRELHVVAGGRGATQGGADILDPTLGPHTSPVTITNECDWG